MVQNDTNCRLLSKYTGDKECRGTLFVPYTNIEDKDCRAIIWLLYNINKHWRGTLFSSYNNRK